MEMLRNEYSEELEELRRNENQPCYHLNDNLMFRGDLFAIKVLGKMDMTRKNAAENILSERNILIIVVAIRDIIPPPRRDAFDDVYIAYELMDTDLHQIICSNQGLSEDHC